MEFARPEFAPDPSLSREEMEDLQREIAEEASFADEFGFDPAAVALGDSLPLAAVRREANQTTLDDGAPDEAPQDAGALDGDAPVVVGVDQAFLDERAISALVAIRDGEVVERTHAVSPLSIPYIPGLLSFREGGPILDAFETLSVDPDLAVFDGSGRIHFRQAGIATHMGVVLGLPSVGVAKSLLCGTPEEAPDGRPEGWRTPVVADGRVEAPAGTVLGYAYQSRQYANSQSINPLYVSSGHRVAAETSVELVAALCGGYKLPEPTRLADKYADKLKREYE